ncbi:MAG: TRAP transporter small permease [Butyricicoccus sp.]
MLAGNHPLRAEEPSTVTEEILRYLLVWTTMVGGAYAYGRRKHLSINMLAKKLPARAQKLLDIFVQAIVIAFCVVVMIIGDLRLVETTFNQISSALHLPMPYVYASILVGGVLIIFYAIIFILEDIGQCASCRRPQPSKKGEHQMSVYRSACSCWPAFS